ncbi:MAG: tRNA (adenosine(37)-N6)-threonylcarbamoyltransferase complex ATPase subunit type 1 TsaE [Candidatus Omnitrophica bacterium CG11_big_fil_rev_8_21_14_0_20_63_9]|nr:MAG: tRNA (adenosine(37)-N6)-threonylcarbamoyltransferase complex ATPase subunit type 1 TsaE [Candidatus Omnitrophica bacterium CG11_big_fil_rev_8_21_14_0_20_63_9]
MAARGTKRQTQQGGAEFITASVEETQALGERLGGLLQAGDVVALHGELGSGKTTLIQGIAQGLGRDPASIKSPTFVLMREYPGDLPVVHIDGYRLEGAPAVSWLDLDLIFSPHKLTLIEWAERFERLLPDERLEVRLSHISANRRRLIISGHGSRAERIVKELAPTSSGPQPAAEPEPHVTGD